MKEKFDYAQAIKSLEEIIAKVEDPSTGLDEIDTQIKKTEELVEACRKYLRSLREKVESIN